MHFCILITRGLLICQYFSLLNMHLCIHTTLSKVKVEKMISNKQLRAGRALLNLDQKEITDATGINVNQISSFERGIAGLSVKNINKLTEFFISSGIEFLPYDGVRFAPNGAIRSLSGKEGLRELYDDIYKVAETVGGAIDIFNGLPKAIITNLGEDWYKSHIERMIKIKDKYCLRAIVQDGDQNFIGSEFAPGEGKDRGWIDAGLFGTLTLVE